MSEFSKRERETIPTPEDEEKKLSPEEEYFRGQIDEGKTYDWIEKQSKGRWTDREIPLKLPRADIEKVVKPKKVGRIMRELNKFGLVKSKFVFNDILITELHPEKLEKLDEFFEQRLEGRILKLLNENPGLSRGEIHERSKIGYSLGAEILRNMKSTGLIDVKVKGRSRYYFTKEFLEKATEKEIIKEIEERNREVLRKKQIETELKEGLANEIKELVKKHKFLTLELIFEALELPPDITEPDFKKLIRKLIGEFQKERVIKGISSSRLPQKKIIYSPEHSGKYKPREIIACLKETAEQIRRTKEEKAMGEK